MASVELKKFLVLGPKTRIETFKEPYGPDPYPHRYAIHSPYQQAYTAVINRLKAKLSTTFSKL